MNVKLMLPLGLLLSLGVAVAEAQAADKNYECVVKDNAGRILVHTLGGTGLFAGATSDSYATTAATATAAEVKAIAAANGEHNNKAVSANCKQVADPRVEY